MNAKRTLAVCYRRGSLQLHHPLDPSLYDYTDDCELVTCSFCVVAMAEATVNRLRSGAAGMVNGEKWGTMRGARVDMAIIDDMDPFEGK